MQGKDRFSSAEAQQIRDLLTRKTRAARDEQKRLRQRIRELGFYISDFQGAPDGFSTADFDQLVSRKVITISGEKR